MISDEQMAQYQAEGHFISAEVPPDLEELVTSSELQLGWTDLRTNPHDKDFLGGWHRDLTPGLTLAGSGRLHSEDDPKEQLDGRFVWRMEENVCRCLPTGVRIYYDRWRDLQEVE